PKLEWLVISNNTVDDPIINTDGGGGIGCIVASPVIRNVTVVNNQTLGPRSTGGGIWLFFSNAILSDVKVIGNSSGDCCGGVHIDVGSPIMQRILIKGNKAVASTGGISIGSSNAKLTDAVIDSNYALRAGGMVTGNGAPTLKNVSITRNWTGPTGEGGGLSIAMDADLSSWENVRIEGNRAGLRGGGVEIDAISTDTIYISNLTVVNNSVDSFDGGGIYIRNLRPVFNNVTVTGNSAPRNGGGIFGRGTLKPILVNCIVYGNTSSTTEVHIEDGDIIIAHSNIRGEVNGVTLTDGAALNWLDGNINADPLFADTLARDYTLSANSPCIDAGTAFLEIAGELLLDLPSSEYLGTAPDMGSAEFDPSVNIDPIVNNQFTSFELFQNYPNPFNPQTEIAFQLPDTEFVTLNIFDVTGKLVRTLVRQKLSAGMHKRIWDGTSKSGNPVGSGIYFYRLAASDFTRTKKMMLIR
ncbi:MAG: FlgD immunoglobulin-like domain containing protein, partial [Calditrichota bacterium]